MEVSRHNLIGAVVLGDNLGSLRDGVLAQLAGQEEPERGLYLPVADVVPLLAVDQLRGRKGDPREQVVEEGVDDAHGLVIKLSKKYLKKKSTFHILSSLIIMSVGAYKTSGENSLTSVLQRDHSGPPPSFSNPPSLQASLLLQTYPTFDTQNFSSHFPLNFFLNVRTSFGQFYSLSDVFFPFFEKCLFLVC